MSLFRTVVAAVAAMGLAGMVFAADETTSSTQGSTDTQSMQVADQTDATTPQGKLNLNTATPKELMTIKGMTRAKVKAIVSYRKKHGDFKSLDDLKQVKGFNTMSDESMQEIMNQLSV